MLCYVARQYFWKFMERCDSQKVLSYILVLSVFNIKCCIHHQCVGYITLLLCIVIGHAPFLACYVFLTCNITIEQTKQIELWKCHYCIHYYGKAYRSRNHRSTTQYITCAYYYCIWVLLYVCDNIVRFKCCTLIIFYKWFFVIHGVNTVICRKGASTCGTCSHNVSHRREADGLHGWYGDALQPAYLTL